MLGKVIYPFIILIRLIFRRQQRLKYYKLFYYIMSRMSVFDISTVTVLVGVASITEIQMTRKISKVVLHSQYNAANYVNIYPIK